MWYVGPTPSTSNAFTSTSVPEPVHPAPITCKVFAGAIACYESPRQLRAVFERAEDARTHARMHIPTYRAAGRPQHVTAAK